MGYPAIIGAGKNSSVLHYGRNDSTIAPNDVVLVDAGAEYRCYTADITRCACRFQATSAVKLMKMRTVSRCPRRCHLRALLGKSARCVYQQRRRVIPPPSFPSSFPSTRLASLTDMLPLRQDLPHRGEVYCSDGRGLRCRWTLSSRLPNANHPGLHLLVPAPMSFPAMRTRQCAVVLSDW